MSLCGLRAPLAQSKPGQFNYHYGVVVEKNGERTVDTRKEKVMYLYSKTINRESGKLVCSKDWNQYELGDWIFFNTTDQENYFKGQKVEPPVETRCEHFHIEVNVRFFIMPTFITNTKCIGNNKTYTKMWSPEIGLLYCDNESVSSFKLEEGFMYRAWVRWSMRPLCFNDRDQDPYHFPYEPLVYWMLIHKDNNKTAACLGPINDFCNEVEELKILAKHQTQLEIMIKYFYIHNKLPSNEYLYSRIPKEMKELNYIKLSKHTRDPQCVSKHIFGVLPRKFIYFPVINDIVSAVNGPAIHTKSMDYNRNLKNFDVQESHKNMYPTRGRSTTENNNRLTMIARDKSQTYASSNKISTKKSKHHKMIPQSNKVNNNIMKKTTFTIKPDIKKLVVDDSYEEGKFRFF